MLRKKEEEKARNQRIYTVRFQLYKAEKQAKWNYDI